jgi:L-iditol 2-dehydrogenase
MKAGYLVAPGRVEVRNEPVPAPEPGGLVVRVRAALTDGTDLKAFRRGHPQMPFPSKFGHEFSGDVSAVGARCAAFAAGDAIMCVHSAPCGACYWCERAQEELCESVMSTKILGAYAEFIAVPERIVAQNAFRKPTDLSYEAAAFLEPLACVVHSLGAAALAPGDVALVIGDGGFGILHALLARARGARPILAGRRAERLATARSMGIADVVDSSADLAAAVRAASGGRGADAVIETTGTQAVWESAPDFARRGGTAVLFGGLPGGARVTYDAARLHYDEVRLVSPFHFTPRDVRAAFDLLASHAIEPLPLVSDRFALARLPEAFAELDAGHGLKYAIVPEMSVRQ